MLERIAFANQLRAVAAICVACSHLIGVFWAIPEVVSTVTATPPQHGDIPGVFWLVSHQWFNLGPFGVGVFFLISGMVVPFSLEKHTGRSFLLARLLRIFPTYAAALLLGLAAVSLSSHIWDLPLPFTPLSVFTNLTLVYDFLRQPSLDLVNWTLSVELKFYLLIVVFSAAIRRASTTTVIAIGLVICLGNAIMASSGNLAAASSTPSYTLSSHSLCLIYMLIGTLFNFHLRGKLSLFNLLSGVVTLSAVFALTWHMSVWRDQFPVVIVNYGYALVLFSILYAGRAHVPGNKWLDGMASISFPFYLLHSLLGFTFIRWFMVGGGFSYSVSVTLAVAAVLALSVVLNRVVERPTQIWGRHLISARQTEQIIQTT